MSDTTEEESVIIEFISEETDDLLEEIELPAAEWQALELIAEIESSTPEQVLREALQAHLDENATD